MKAIPWDGETITKPGMYANLPMDDYHRHDICDGPSISSSGLRAIFNESPAHFYAGWSGNPNRVQVPEDKKRHFIVGRATHHLHLGQSGFASIYCVQPADYEDEETGATKPWNNNAGICKRWNAARAKEGKTILKPAEVVMIRGMAGELSRHPIVRAGALNGQVERSIFWKDKATGIWLKSRPDTIPGSSGDFVDYKTTESVMWTDLMRTIENFGYHQQGSIVRDAARIVLKIEKPTFALVFQEKKEPWCVRVVTVKDNDLDLGARANRAALQIFATCLKTKRWPGPGGDREDAEYIEMSEFAHKRIEDRLTILGAG